MRTRPRYPRRQNAQLVTGARTFALLALSALALGGCLGGQVPESTRVKGPELTVYSSLPAHGASAPVAAAVAAGEQLALAEAGGQVGDKRVRLVVLDSTAPGDLLWDPGLVSANAERAVDDPTTIAYLGELDYGASAVSVPITNDADILQVSPGDGLTSLTRTPPGRPRGGPERYYPSDVRSFLRLTPNDLLQAETLLARIREAGASRLAVVSDPDIYGRELSAELVARARRDGPQPVVAEEYDDEVGDIPDLVRTLVPARPDAVVYAGIAGPGTGRLLAAIDQRLPGVPVYATAGVLARDPALPIPVAPERVEALGAIPPASRMPADGRRVLRTIARADGPARARPEALYGYEAMRLVLDALRSAGPDRRAVMRAALAIRTRDSVIGRYEIRATGDVSTDSFAFWALHGGRFVFSGIVR
jgi:branched-chain amino acid transport system substrate-binding protein